MSFANPFLLLLLVLIPLALYGKRKRSAAFALTITPEARRITPSTRTVLRRPVLQSLFVIALASAIIALARPQMGTQFSETESSGRDIMLALDVSGSMQAMDFFIDGDRVSRLAALQHVVKTFIDDRLGDRMGLVVFGEEAYTQCPLTLDHHILKGFIESLTIGMAGNGTAIGNALAVSLKRIKDLEAESRVIVLVTDGKNNAGAVTPKEAAAAAASLGIVVHTVGIGSDGAAPMPIRGPFGLSSLRNQQMEFDEETLKHIAKTTGGSYFNARDLAGLTEVYAQIDQLEERTAETFEYIEYEEKYHLFALISLIAFLLHLLLSSTTLLVVPEEEV